MGIFSLPALVLLAAFVGFAGFAREVGLSLAETAFMVPLIWALPSHVLLVDGMVSGASILVVAAAVALASVRMMPMVMALMPEMRAEKTPRTVLFLVSHFVAVTAWVVAMARLRDIPRDMRVAWFAGLGLALSGGCTLVAVTVYLLAATMPPLISGALFFLTPIYFLTSLWASARVRAEHYAMVMGLVLGPLFHLIWPEADVLIAGVLGGALAYGLHRFLQRRGDAG
ncbi:MAG: AzlC family ABC transporter permease [Pseudomonadota bacterium]